MNEAQKYLCEILDNNHKIQIVNVIKDIQDKDKLTYILAYVRAMKKLQNRWICEHIEALESLRDGIIGEWDKAYQEDLKESEEDVFNEWSGTVFIIYRIRKRYIEKNNRAD